MLVVLCTASFLAVVDTTIVSIALPSIRGSLRLSVEAAQWVLGAYALVFGGVLLLAGRLADRYGRRRAFLAGLVLFAAGSALAGGAVDAAALFVGRVVQALGAAAFVPSSVSLLTTGFPDRAERNRALGAYGAMAGLGFVAGMLGGGVITELWGWRWIFLLNLPVVAGTLLFAVRVLSESRDRRASGPLDVGGAATVTAGLVLVIVALAAAPQHSWTSLRTWVSGLAGMAALVAFAAVERRHRAPLVPPVLVGRPVVLVPNGAVAVQSMIGIAWLFLLTLYFQDVQGWDPLATGLLFAPMTAAALIGAWVAGRLATAAGVRLTALS
jgi:MFS family permease